MQLEGLNTNDAKRLGSVEDFGQALGSAQAKGSSKGLVVDGVREACRLLLLT